MSDLRYLHSEAFRIRQRAHEKLSHAYKEITKALSFSKASDYKKAAEKGALATHFYDEALQLEHEAMEIDHHSSDLELKAHELEMQTSELQRAIGSKLEMIYKIKRSIVGNY